MRQSEGGCVGRRDGQDATRRLQRGGGRMEGGAVEKHPDYFEKPLGPPEDPGAAAADRQVFEKCWGGSGRIY